MRNALAIICGALVGMAFVSAFDALAGRLFPFMSGVDFTDRAAVATAMQRAPIGAMAVLVFGTFAAALSGAFVARKVVTDSSRRPSYIVGGLLLVGVIANFVMLPHPLLMMIASPIVAIAGTLLGIRLAGAQSGARSIPSPT